MKKSRRMRLLRLKIAFAIMILMIAVMLIDGKKVYGCELYRGANAVSTLNETIEESTTKAMQEARIKEKEKVNVSLESVEPKQDTSLIELSDSDEYLLAKIAMAEAEGESIKVKCYVIKTVIDRIESDIFPDTVQEVIYQKNQFSPISDGRWNKVEPNEECYEAVEMVLQGDIAADDCVLFFESCKSESWQSKSRELVYQEGSMRFYS